MNWQKSPSNLEITFDNKAGWEIRFIALPTSGSCRTGMEKSFQLDGNKVYWSHTGAEQMAWRCVTSPSGRKVRLVASSPQPSTKFADVGLGRVVASGSITLRFRACNAGRGCTRREGARHLTPSGPPRRAARGTSPRCATTRAAGQAPFAACCGCDRARRRSLVAAPLDEAVLFESVEHSDELTSVEAEDVGDARLRLRGAFAEQGEHAVLTNRAARRLELLDHPQLDAESDAGEEECSAGQQFLREEQRFHRRFGFYIRHGIV